ncbi:MAG TPA: phosphoenolpyruvate--protein phosphotransferase, partial [Acidisphaera sp.]|nr:phosphoenolpyruvate--protein phosphotransferase [Acidisphaera sp.]
ALDEVPDPVFSGRILGDGIAIDPFEPVLRAPCDGVVTTLHSAHHALTLRTSEGAEILVHIGLDTVTLKGEGFQPHVAEGQAVHVGDPLITFDMGFLAEHVRSLLAPVIVANPDAFVIVSRTVGQEVRSGDTVLALRPAQPKPAKTPAAADGRQARRDVVERAPDGIHARPAGLIAETLRNYRAEVRLQARGRTVSARGAVGVMGLGVRGGDTVTILGAGEDAEAAVEAVAALLQGETPSTSDAEGRPVSQAEAPAAQAQAAAPKEALADFRPGAEVVLRGVAAAPGAAVGTAARMQQAAFDLSETGAGSAAEGERLTQALSKAESGLRAALDGAAGKPGPAHAILSAHLAFLQDPELRDRAQALVGAGKTAARAWHDAIEEQVVVLRGLGDARMAERADDLRDVEERVLAALAGRSEAARTLPEGAVLVAEDLLPSQVAGLAAGRIAGICTAGGGPTSHVAILAASMGIPALMAVGPDVLRVPDGAPVILDADAGVLRVFPPKETAEARRSAIATARARAEADLAAAHEDCRTADGVRIEVVANLGGVADVAGALAHGAEGSGLLRSEFLFLDRAAAPTEDEQAAEYQAIATALGGRPLIVRTLDAGADKALPYLNMPAEANPELGVRGIRLCLARPELLRAQLRAILKVQPAGQCRIMLPMVADLAELRAARAILEEEKAKLGRADAVQLGIMVEVPSAAMMAEVMAAEADFFSVGTNDLTQYVLAMDRLNPALARHMDALHPAVLRLIARTVEGARAHGRWVGVCGGLASVALAAPVLIGLGVTELSATAAAIPRIKAFVRRLDMAACAKAAQAALAQTSAEAVRAMLTRTWPSE